ncbi:MAG: hypothetical protein ACRDMV_04880 [Streptosporangiales bacterium]
MTREPCEHCGGLHATNPPTGETPCRHTRYVAVTERPGQIWGIAAVWALILCGVIFVAAELMRWWL